MRVNEATPDVEMGFIVINSETRHRGSEHPNRNENFTYEELKIGCVKNACACVLELVMCWVRFARVSCPWLRFGSL